MKTFHRHLLIHKLIDLAFAIILISLLHACGTSSNRASTQEKIIAIPVAPKALAS